MGNNHDDEICETCSALAAALPGRVFESPHKEFQNSVRSYDSTQEQQRTPKCIVKLQNAVEVSESIKILRRAFDNQVDNTSKSKPLQFAVRSGGHGLQSAANVEGGIVLDLSSINEVTVLKDANLVVLGTGARWLDVSSKLDSMGLAVAGGRNSAVGVGGFTLGGGISFFSSSVGLACSNVVNYEVILADGTIVSASVHENPDLWRALKGGANNFGIVTRFTVSAFPTSGVWGGHFFSTFSKAPKVIEAFNDFAALEDASTYDEHAAGPIISFSHLRSFRTNIVASIFMYTKPVPWPACFDGFKAIKWLWSTAKIRSLTSATKELRWFTPRNMRIFQATTTVRHDFHTLETSYTHFRKEVERVPAIKQLSWCLAFQLLPQAAYSKGEPNSLGLSSRRSSLVIVTTAAYWKKADDDALVERLLMTLIADIDAIATSNGVADSFRYLNYASKQQDPLGSYGVENKRFLHETSQVYDPNQFFQRARVGGFKLE